MKSVGVTALCVATLLSWSNISAQHTAQTFYHPSSTSAWLDPFVTKLNHEMKPSTAMRNTFHAEGFYWRSREKTKLGKYFGYKDATNIVRNELSVDTDTATALFPQQIIHDSANAASFADPAVNPLEAILTFSPYIEQYGALLANSTHITDAISIHVLMPWIHQVHDLGLVVTNSTPQAVEGSNKTVEDFFAGNVSQVAALSPDQQDALAYGKIKKRQTHTGLADISLKIVGELAHDEQLTFCVGGTVTLPTSGRPTAHYLFEPVLGTGGHVLLGVQADARLRIGTMKGVALSGIATASHTVGIGAQEVRSASYQNNAGLDLQFARYALAGKHNARRLFPFINMLTQPVDVTPGSATDIAVGLHCAYHWLQARIFYRFTHTGAEKVTPRVAWPAGTYGEAAVAFEQIDSGSAYHTFDVSSDSILATSALLAENILFSAAATPTQQTHTAALSISGTPFKHLPQTSFILRGHYSFTSGATFGLGGAGGSAAFSHTF